MEIKSKREYKKTERVQDSFCESSAEYVLPDYNTDVRKILFSKADVRPAGKFVSSDEVEFTGIVNYDVIYSDSDNNVSAASFSSDYDFSVKCPMENYADCYANVKLANSSLRLVGPRKFSAKSQLTLETKVVENGALSISGSALLGEESPQVNTETVGVHTSFISESIEREYAEEIANLENAIADEVRVIYTGAEAISTSTEVMENGVTVNGTLRIVSVIQNGDEPAYLIEKSVPIEETVPFSEVGVDMQITPVFIVTSLKTSVNPTDSGVSVVVSSIVELYVIGELNENVEIVTDAYMQSSESDAGYSTFTYTELMGGTKTTSPVSCDFARSLLEGENVRECHILASDAKIESISGEREGVRVEGEIKYSGIATEVNETGGVSYFPLKLSTRFNEYVNLGLQNADDLKFEVRAKSHSATATLDSLGVYVNSALTISASAYKEEGVKVLASLDVNGDKPTAVSSSRVVVYYPSEDETLFSVAKKFHSTKKKIALDNSLTQMVGAIGGGDDVKLVGVKKLVIM